ncbi:YegS/Rv2252/BmrU family lipid kinase [Thermosynechococcaceae cyanobacterium BACA0444]|uniref:YegS/Rv2252/BmrU family lipid kinase n=1 Tax=Pseudocalidococcus azoricus BACA0444 TaxID=2918990 RepID=A0AAE4FRE1_9CYAN|nr:YegS/Rv2252/BmrU family lipid kinase [Pseudocalidococcus azoricus]MDS3859877.1 YegS/Rv2252/BmrU family lipid kinase [Pseudocalidococcus azoricus BACA0444]
MSQPTLAFGCDLSGRHELAEFLQAHAVFLRRFRLLIPRDLEVLLPDHLHACPGIEFLPEVGQGAEIMITAKILAQEITAVFWWGDYWPGQSGEMDLIIRYCAREDIPLSLNAATAWAILTKAARYPHACLIFNPVAGQGDARQTLLQIRSLLKPYFHLTVLTTTPTSSAESLVKQALESEMDTILAAGGDGTISAVAHALVGTNIPLGVIPTGTANAFGSALGLPGIIPAACEVIIAGHTRQVDIAACEVRGGDDSVCKQTMILLTGIGFEAETVERANREVKDRFGSLAYIWAGVQQFQSQFPFTAELVVDGQTTEITAAAITVANAAPITSVLAYGTGDVIMDDGLMDITIVAPADRLQAFNSLLELFGSAIRKVAPNRDDIIGLRGKTLEIKTDPPQKVVVDGEILGTTPLTMKTIPQGLVVFAPF